MKHLAAAFFTIVLLLLAYGCLAQPASAQDRSDTLRELVILVHEKQPDTNVELHINDPKGYNPYGTISHIGDDYVCVMRNAQNGQQVYVTENCVPFKLLIDVEMNPGIHR